MQMGLFKVTESESLFSDSNILTLVFASHLPMMALGRMNGVQTKQTPPPNKTPITGMAASPHDGPYSIFLVKCLLPVVVLMCTFPAEECGGINWRQVETVCHRPSAFSDCLPVTAGRSRAYPPHVAPMGSAAWLIVSLCPTTSQHPPSALLRTNY
jgi:hypothetical protein